MAQAQFKQKPTVAYHELQRWLKEHTDAGVLPAQVTAIPPEDLKRICKGEMLNALAFLLPRLLPPTAMRHVRMNLSLAGSKADESQNCATRVAKLHARKAALKEEIRTMKQRHSVATAACASMNQKLQAAEVGYEERHLRHQEAWQRTALFEVLTGNCQAMTSALQSLHGRLHQLLAKVVEESPGQGGLFKYTSTGMASAAPAVPPKIHFSPNGLQGAAQVRELERRCAHCCFTFRQECRGTPRHPDGQKEVAETASATMKDLRQQHLREFTKTEEIRNSSHVLCKKNTAMRERLQLKLLEVPSDQAALLSRWHRDQQRQALRQAALTYVKDEALRLLELQSELAAQRRDNQDQLQQLDALESQRQQRFRDLRRRVTEMQHRHSGVKRSAIEASRTLSELPKHDLRAALTQAADFSSANVVLEADAANHLPLTSVLQNPQGLLLVIPSTCPVASDLVRIGRCIGVGSSSNGTCVLQALVMLLMREMRLQRHSHQWGSLRVEAEQFLQEIRPSLQNLQVRHRESEAQFTDQCTPSLREAVLDYCLHPRVPQVQDVAEDWVFEPAAYTLSLPVEDITVEQWMQRYRKLVAQRK